ncbi:MAG: hypothetical protein AAGJ83_03685, partial [Planctomycetota bacterium]
MFRLPRLLFAFCLLAICVASSSAQDICFPQAYRLRPVTVCEPQVVETMRPVYETRMVEQPVTTYRPVVRTSRISVF